MYYNSGGRRGGRRRLFAAIIARKFVTVWRRDQDAAEAVRWRSNPVTHTQIRNQVTYRFRELHYGVPAPQPRAASPASILATPQIKALRSGLSLGMTASASEGKCEQVLSPNTTLQVLYYIFVCSFLVAAPPNQSNLNLRVLRQLEISKPTY